MTDADPSSHRPASGSGFPSPMPSSPRPSVGSRNSRSSLRREQQIHAGTHQNTPSQQAYPPDPPSADSQQQAPAPPPAPAFEPFFALVTDTTVPTRPVTHYPSVSYVFDDDDPAILTEALAQHHRTGDEEEEDETLADGIAERAVLVDMKPTMTSDGGTRYEVAWASSLRVDWAVVSSSVDIVGGANRAGPGMVMLRVEGVGVDHPPPGPGRGKVPTPEGEMGSSSGGSGARQHGLVPNAAEEYAGLIEDFERRMVVLRRVVQAGEERRRAIEDAEEDLVDQGEAADMGEGERAEDMQPGGDGANAGQVSR